MTDDILGRLKKAEDELAQWRKSFDGHVYVKKEDYVAVWAALKAASDWADCCQQDRDMANDTLRAHLNDPEEQRLKEMLWSHCLGFINAQKITDAECVYQSDHVIQNAYDFVGGICEIVGYCKEAE